MVKRKLSDKEFFIIRTAWQRINAGRYDSPEGWDRFDKVIRFRWKRLFRRLVAVAGIVLVVLGYWGWSSTGRTEEVIGIQEIKRAQGSPVLILANGKELALEKQNLKDPIRQGNTKIFADSGRLTLQYTGDSLKGNNHSLTYNTLRIPQGGEYSLTLADGSRIWLNSETTLRYPVNFTGKFREIELEGEAYFEVTPDSLRPFYVRMGNQSVEVLGTHFNVSHYKSDTLWHATLVEGKVKIHSGGHSCILQSGTHYKENTVSGHSEIIKVNTQLYTSWKDGKVFFQDERLEDIIRKLARWYDFDIFYTNPAVKDLHFGGTINKYNSFEVVLRYLERTAGVRFDIHGKTVIVGFTGSAI